jgi:hypothetical protein
MAGGGHGSDQVASKTLFPGRWHWEGTPWMDVEEEIYMPKKWTEKQEREYQHIVDSEMDQGRSTKRAKEIAARTVNKERAQKGQTKTASRSSTHDMLSAKRGGQRSGTNRAKGRTKAQLYNEARQRGVKGRSSMTKDQLRRAVDAKK